MKSQIHADLEAQNLPQLRGSPVTGCTGTIRRTGWTYQSIDLHTWKLPSWTCDKCGEKWWSYFDNDNGEEGFDTDAECDDEEDY